MTIGMVLVAFLAARAPVVPVGHYHFHLEANQLRRYLGETVQFPFGIWELNDNVLALDVSKIAQALSKCPEAGRDRGRGAGI
jgi:hypothetical protein